jgi:hypothetical protein
MSNKFDPMDGYQPGAPLKAPEEPRGEIGFSMDIEANMGLLGDILSGITRDKGNRAMRAAQEIEKVVMGVMNTHIGDPAASLGITFAIHKIAKLLVNSDKQNEAKNQGLIQLLS